MLPTVCPGDDVIDVVLIPRNEGVAVGAHPPIPLVDHPALRGLELERHQYGLWCGTSGRSRPTLER
jgi:hypothetical protein